MKHNDPDEEWWVMLGTPEAEAVTQLAVLIYKLKKAESLDKIMAILKEDREDMEEIDE